MLAALLVEAYRHGRRADLLAREHATGASPHEVVRRLLRTAIEHSAGGLRNDTTMVYLRWAG